MLTVGFLGGGNMATALVGGLLRGEHADLTVHVVDHHEEKLAPLAAQGAETHLELGDWVMACDLLVLAVKPQTMQKALEPVKALLNPAGSALSIAAGIESAALSRWLGGYRVLRAMPNTPAMVGCGVSGLWIPEG
uniref:pyrroline-5-carboxylate reductase family protein n=1 Tax=Sutterella sp. TaxID=1981025 RepID=UPI003FD8EEDF